MNADGPPSIFPWKLLLAGVERVGLAAGLALAFTPLLILHEGPVDSLGIADWAVAMGLWLGLSYALFWQPKPMAPLPTVPPWIEVAIVGGCAVAFACFVALVFPVEPSLADRALVVALRETGFPPANPAFPSAVLPTAPFGLVIVAGLGIGAWGQAIASVIGGLLFALGYAAMRRQGQQPFLSLAATAGLLIAGPSWFSADRPFGLLVLGLIAVVVFSTEWNARQGALGGIAIGLLVAAAIGFDPFTGGYAVGSALAAGATALAQALLKKGSLLQRFSRFCLALWVLASGIGAAWVMGSDVFLRAEELHRAGLQTLTAEALPEHAAAAQAFADATDRGAVAIATTPALAAASLEAGRLVHGLEEATALAGLLEAFLEGKPLAEGFWTVLGARHLLVDKTRSPGRAALAGPDTLLRREIAAGRWRLLHEDDAAAVLARVDDLAPLAPELPFLDETFDGGTRFEGDGFTMEGGALALGPEPGRLAFAQVEFIAQPNSWLRLQVTWGADLPQQKDGEKLGLAPGQNLRIENRRGLPLAQWSRGAGHAPITTDEKLVLLIESGDSPYERLRILTRASGDEATPVAIERVRVDYLSPVRPIEAPAPPVVAWGRLRSFLGGEQ